MFSQGHILIDWLISMNRIHFFVGLYNGCRKCLCAETEPVLVPSAFWKMTVVQSLKENRSTRLTFLWHPSHQHYRVFRTSVILSTLCDSLNKFSSSACSPQPYCLLMHGACSEYKQRPEPLFFNPLFLVSGVLWFFTDICVNRIQQFSREEANWV